MSLASPGPQGPRAGAALVSTILFALVILVLGHGILVLARTQRWIAAVDGVRWIEDETRQAALRDVLAAMDSLPAAGLLTTEWGIVEVRELGPELRLLAIEPEPGSPGTGWATLVAAPMPVPRVLDRSGGARVGGVVFEAGGLRQSAHDEACPPGLGFGSLAEVGPLPGAAQRPRLGVLDFEDLLAGLPGLDDDRLALAGTGPSACEEPGGFGDPDRPGACPGVWGAGGRAGDLTVEGRGQGILAVSGDLTLAADTRFRGWVWVGGTLRVNGGAQLLGLADVGDRLVVEPGGALATDGCTAALALEASKGLWPPKRVGPRAWPLFRW